MDLVNRPQVGVGVVLIKDHKVLLGKRKGTHFERRSKSFKHIKVQKFMNLNKILRQVTRKPRVHGYVHHYAKTRFSSIQGLGLFAAQTIKKSSVVAVWGGRVITKKEIKTLPKSIAFNYALELYPGFYLAETKESELDASDFINHSCSANCKIVNNFIMVAKKDIKAEEELTADFSSRTKTPQKFICNCGAKNCKKIIYYN